MKLQRYGIILCSAVLICIGEIYSFLSLGKYISYVFPCQQIPSNSFPCYANYDLGIIGILILISIIALIGLGIALYKKNRA